MALRTSRAETETTHWWYVGRRAILASLASQLPPGPRLEVGCGYFGGIASGAAPGIRVALDLEHEKLAVVRDRHGAAPVCAAGEQLPFAGASFASCLLLDVLEHLRDDWLALSEACRILRPGGRALVTVPAFPSLWSAHDVAEMHFRRYKLRDLRRLCEGVGFRIIRSGHFNTLLFPAALVWRLVSRRLYRNRTPRDDFYMPPRPVNKFLAALLGAERFVAPHFPLPLGLSAFAVLEKP